MSFKHIFRPQRSKSAAVGAGLAGVATGAAITYFLYETETGARKRQVMKEKFFELKEKVKNKASKVYDEVGEIGYAGKEVYDEMADFLKENAKDIKSLSEAESTQLASRIRERWETTRDDIEEMISSVKS